LDECDTAVDQCMNFIKKEYLGEGENKKKKKKFKNSGLIYVRARFLWDMFSSHA